MGTIKVYKLFRKTDNHITPLFIDRERILITGVWHKAWAPSDYIINKIDKGFALISSFDNIIMRTNKKPTHSDVIIASLSGQRWIEIRQGKRHNRLVYDLGLSTDNNVIPFAHRPGWHSCREPDLPGVSMDGKVWCECLIPADDYITIRRNINGMTPVSQQVEWYISHKILIVKEI